MGEIYIKGKLLTRNKGWRDLQSYFKHRKQHSWNVSGNIVFLLIDKVSYEVEMWKGNFNIYGRRDVGHEVGIRWGR